MAALTRSRLPRRFAASDKGVAALEFAIVLPVMVTMLIGMTEITLGVNMDRKLTLLSRSLGDLTSRTGALTSSDLTDVFQASTVVLQPYDGSKARMVVSSIKVTKNGSNYQGSVAWSCASGTGAATKATTVTYSVPTGFQADGTYYIVAETILPYQPIFGRFFSGTVNLSENTPWPVRNNAKVTIKGSSCPSFCTCPEGTTT